MMSLLSLQNCFANYGMILGNWIEDNGWYSAITEAEVTSSSKTQSLLSVFHVSYAHQVTAVSLNILAMKTYKIYTA